MYDVNQKIAKYDDKKLPAFMLPLRNLCRKVDTLINDIRSDVMGFYNVSRWLVKTFAAPYHSFNSFEI